MRTTSFQGMSFAGEALIAVHGGPVRYKPMMGAWSDSFDAIVNDKWRDEDPENAAVGGSVLQSTLTVLILASSLDVEPKSGTVPHMRDLLEVDDVIYAVMNHRPHKFGMWKLYLQDAEEGEDE